MGVIKRLNKWANAHTYLPLDLLRMALGVFLFIKGINFMEDTGQLIDMIGPLRNNFGGMLMVHYVAPAHFLGGILIFFGLLTRWAAIAQLPILFGAILINFIGEMVGINLVLSTITFVLCLFFAIYGSGKRSADYYFKMQQ